MPLQSFQPTGAPARPLSAGSRTLPPGVVNGTYALRPLDAGTLEIDVREFIGWWETEQQNFVRKVREAEPTTIRLSIASTGGFWEDALALHDFLKGYPARVEVEITGTTASAATIIALAGDAISMSANALYLPHYVRYGVFAFGTVEDVAQAADQALRAHRKFNAVTFGLYQKRIGAEASGDLAALDALLQSDEWLTAEETLAWGFIDAVFEPGEAGEEGEEDAEASHALAAVAHVPAPEVLKALGLPPLPSLSGQPVPALASAPPPPDPASHTQPNPTMPLPKKTTPAAPNADVPDVPEAHGDPTPEATAPPAPVPDPQKEARTDARLKALEAENARLKAERRAAALDALRQTATGRMPGVCVEALVEVASVAAVQAEKAGATAHAFTKPLAASAHVPVEAGLVERLTQVVAQMPSLVEPHALVLDAEDPDADLFARAWEAM